MKNWQPLVFGPELCFAFFLARDGREGWKGGMEGRDGEGFTLP